MNTNQDWPIIEVVAGGLPGGGKSTVVKSIGGKVEINDKTEGLSDTSKTVVLDTAGGKVVDTPGHPDNREKADGSPLYTTNDIKKDIIQTTAEGGFNRTRHFAVHLPASVRKTAEMYDAVKFAKDYVVGNAKSVEILVTAPQGAKFLEGAQTVANDLGIPNAPIPRYLAADHVPDDIAASGRYVVLKEDDPQANFEALKTHFADVDPVTTAAHNTRCKVCGQVCDPRCMDPCHKGPIQMKHGDTHTVLEHTASQEARHARMVAKPPAALRMVEGLVGGASSLVPPPYKLPVVAGSVATLIGVERFGGSRECENCGRPASADGCIARHLCCKRTIGESGCTEVKQCEYGHNADGAGCLTFCQNCKRDPTEPHTGCDKYGQVEHDLETI